MECNFRGNKMSNVVVHEGAAADFSGCTMRAARRLLGMAVNGTSSSATARDCTFEGNAERNVAVIEGAAADFANCSMSDSKSLQVGGGCGCGGFTPCNH